MIIARWMRRHEFAVVFSVLSLLLAIWAEIGLWHHYASTCPKEGAVDCGVVVIYFLMGPAEGVVVGGTVVGAWIDRIRGRRAGWLPSRVLGQPPPSRPDTPPP